MKVQWKPIEKFDGLYLISSTGLVFSTRSNRLIKQQLSNVGYYRVEINIDGKARKYSVHRLVAETFIPNPNNYPIVNHKDENPNNNHVSNLEWCTHKYNSNYGDCQRKIRENTTLKYGADNPASIPVYQFSQDGEFIAEYASAKEAADITGFEVKSISKARTGKLKTYKGYAWRTTKEFKTVQPRPSFKLAGAVLQYDKQGNFIRRYEVPNDTKKYGFDANAVRDVCRGKLTNHKGYKFIYEECK